MHGRDVRTQCIRSTSILLWGKDWRSVRLDRTQSFFTKHSQLIVSQKLSEMEIWEDIYEKVYMSLRPPPKISLKHDWKRELGSEDAQRPEGQVVQQFKSSQSNCKDNTSKDPFSRCAICNNYGYSLRWRWQDKVGLQHQEENLELRMRGETERWDVRHQWQRENQDQHKAHETWHVTWRTRECARSLLVSSCSVLVVILTHCTHIAWLKMSACLSHLIHAWSERPLFDFELSIPSNFLLSFFINLKQFLLPFNFHEVK